jgi:hypothetical protein
MSATEKGLRTSYLDGWLVGVESFRAVAAGTADDERLSQIDRTVTSAENVKQDERADPLVRVAALGLLDGYQAARGGYSAASRARPWSPLVGKPTA